MLKLQRAANRGIPAGKIQLFQRQKKVRSKKKPPTDWKHCFETQNAWQFGKSCVNKKQGSTLANTWRVGEQLKYIYASHKSILSEPVFLSIFYDKNYLILILLI